MKLLPEPRTELDLFALYILLTYVLVPLAIQLLLTLVGTAIPTSETPLHASFSPPAIAVATTAAGIVVIAKSKVLGFKFGFTAPWKFWLAATLFALLVVLFHAISHRLLNSRPHEKFIHNPFAVNDFSLLIIATILAPIFEEFVFRGLLFSWLQKKWGTIPGALIVSAIFTLLHLTLLFSIVESLIFLAFSLGLIALRIWSNSLGPCVLMHATYNFLTILIF